jgi:hypothetical protein
VIWHRRPVPAQPAIGLTLQPDPDYLERLYPLFVDEVDVLEVAPETTWLIDPVTATFTTNSYHAAFREILARCAKPVHRPRRRPLARQRRPATPTAAPAGSPASPPIKNYLIIAGTPTTSAPPLSPAWR